MVVQTVRLAIGVLAALAAVGLTATIAGAHRSKPHCAVPRGWTVVAKDRPAVVISTASAKAIGPGAGPNADPQITRQWRSCLRADGRFRPLAADLVFGGGLGNLVDVGDVVLGGAYAAYGTDTTSFGGRAYGATTGALHIQNLVGRRGRTVGLDRSGAGLLQISAAGIAVWQSAPLTQPGDQTACGAWLIQALDVPSGRSATLDNVTPACSATAPVIFPVPPFGGLQLQRCVAGCFPVGATFAWWTHGGVWRSARVR